MATISRGYVNLFPPWYFKITLSYIILVLSFTKVTFSYDVSCGTTTSDSYLAMCHMVPRPVPRTWQCVIWYHDQCISPGIMSYDITTSVFHLAMYYDRKCKITYFYVTNNPFRINVSIVVLSVVFYNDFVQFCVDR
jgi:hypothetical protein